VNIIELDLPFVFVSILSWSLCSQTWFLHLAKDSVFLWICFKFEISIDFFFFWGGGSCWGFDELAFMLCMIVHSYIRIFTYVLFGPCYTTWWVMFM
jgi:hypothetical protein